MISTEWHTYIVLIFWLAPRRDAWDYLECTSNAVKTMFPTASFGIWKLVWNEAARGRSGHFNLCARYLLDEKLVKIYSLFDSFENCQNSYEICDVFLFFFKEKSENTLFVFFLQVIPSLESKTPPLDRSQYDRLQNKWSIFL